MAGVHAAMLPLFLPPDANVNVLLRVLVGTTAFVSAYMAEVVRGGLQAIPKGQYEAAMSVGLGYWQAMRLIILPQALKITIPNIVNTYIGLFKDTTLVFIVGIAVVFTLNFGPGSFSKSTGPRATSVNTVAVVNGKRGKAFGAATDTEAPGEQVIDDAHQLRALPVDRAARVSSRPARRRSRMAASISGANSGRPCTRV